MTAAAGRRRGDAASRPVYRLGDLRGPRARGLGENRGARAASASERPGTGMAAGKLGITRRQPPACSPDIGAKVPSGPTRAL